MVRENENCVDCLSISDGCRLHTRGWSNGLAADGINPLEMWTPPGVHSHILDRRGARHRQHDQDEVVEAMHVRARARARVRALADPASDGRRGEAFSTPGPTGRRAFSRAVH